MNMSLSNDINRLSIAWRSFKASLLTGEEFVVEKRYVCDICSMESFGFHKGCPGIYMRQERLVSKWSDTGVSYIEDIFAKSRA
jgi:hypothetical protein